MASRSDLRATHPCRRSRASHQLTALIPRMCQSLAHPPPLPATPISRGICSLHLSWPRSPFWALRSSVQPDSRQRGTDEPCLRRNRRHARGKPSSPSPKKRRPRRGGPDHLAPLPLHEGSLSSMESASSARCQFLPDRKFGSCWVNLASDEGGMTETPGDQLIHGAPAHEP